MKEKKINQCACTFCCDRIAVLLCFVKKENSNVYLINLLTYQIIRDISQLMDHFCNFNYVNSINGAGFNINLVIGQYVT